MQPPQNRPYFRPGANASRGQLSKIVCRATTAQAPHGQTFEDCASQQHLHIEIEQLFALGAIGGYPCGNPEHACLARAILPPRQQRDAGADL